MRTMKNSDIFYNWKKLHLFLLFLPIATFITVGVSGQSGQLDLSFGTGGKVVSSNINGNCQINGVALQNDGKIVVAGQAINGSTIDFITARYLTGGTLDNSFNGNGYIKTNFSTPPNYYANTAYSVAIQSDGKIVVAGDNYNGTNYDMAVVRYNSDGTIDSSFNNVGFAFADNGGNETARSMLLQSDGKIVLAGSTSSPDIRFYVARFNTDGTPDLSFGINGTVATDLGPSSEDQILAMSIQQDGKLVACGTSISPSNSKQLGIARYNTDGSPDISFSGDGMLVENYTGKDVFNGIAITAGSQIIVGGSVSDFSNFCVAQFNNDGTADTGFGVNGKTITSLTSFDVHAKSVVIQPDGKILLGGYRYDNLDDNNFAIVRYSSTGSIDSGFDGDGIVETDFSGFTDNVSALIIQPDGKIIAGGFSNTGAIDHMAVARYNNDCIPEFTNQNIQICLGESYSVGNNTYFTNGIYVDTLSTVAGCDSLVTTNLAVLPISSHSQNIDIIQGDSVVIGNNVYYTSGTYLDTLVAANGCDSLLYTTVTVITGISTPENGTGRLFASPNPSSDYIKISGTVTGNIVSIVDQNGKPIFEIKSELGLTMVPLHSLAAGIYYLIYRTDNEISKLKIVKP